MTHSGTKNELELCLFVKSEIDDYGLDPYEFRLYARIARRAGRGEAWESIPRMARACQMSLARARKALQLLEAAGLIESVVRPGYSTLHRLTPKHKWVHPEQLEVIRQSLTPTKSDTPIKSETGVVVELTPLPPSLLVGEGNPLEGNLFKVLPPKPPTSINQVWGGEEVRLEAKADGGIHESSTSIPEQSKLTSELINFGNDKYSAAWSASYLTPLPQHLSVSSACMVCARSELDTTQSDQLKQAAFSREALASPSPTTRQIKSCSGGSPNAQLSPELLQKHNHTASANSFPSSPTSSNPPPFESPQRNQLLDELSQLTGESLENLRLNPNLVSALDRHPGRVKDALAYLKQAITTWKNKPGLGLFISAVNKGAKPSPTQKGGGWKEWADEAIRRRLMSYSQSWNGDILINFASGVQRLWSEVRSLSWIEIEKLVFDDRLSHAT